MTVCAQEGCSSPATHTIVVALTGEVEQAWHMCRRHERKLKTASVRTRAKAGPSPTGEPVIECARCDRGLDLSTTTDPCPDCGSLDRNVGDNDTITVHEDVLIRGRREDDPEDTQQLKIRSGDNYTRDLEAWGQRTMVFDKDNDLYREVIELHDGSRIVSTAKLSDH